MSNLHNVKLTYKRMIVRLSLITLFASGVTLPLSIPSPLPVVEVEAQSCSPAGYAWSGAYFDWIANGTPSSDSCWSHSFRVSFVTGITECGPFTPPQNAWEFYYAGEITQTFTVPSNWTKPDFGIQYELDFIDPNNDGAWNRFEMKVLDGTTGAVLAYDSFNGSMGDLSCNYRSKSWSQNLAGHTITVVFNGSRGYNNTFIRVRNIALFQRLH